MTTSGGAGTTRVPDRRLPAWARVARPLAERPIARAGGGDGGPAARAHERTFALALIKQQVGRFADAQRA
jgi:hypothetical protein